MYFYDEDAQKISDEMKVSLYLFEREVSKMFADENEIIFNDSKGRMYAIYSLDNGECRYSDHG